MESWKATFNIKFDFTEKCRFSFFFFFQNAFSRKVGKQLIIKIDFTEKLQVFFNPPFHGKSESNLMKKSISRKNAGLVFFFSNCLFTENRKATHY